ncbi:MAG: hypothetical protein GF353_05935 [Candidatus Lokiarchaeota archaeon]|nr:hypothetical protein [Candidatus Lokiarchaeota archaeon]
MRLSNRKIILTSLIILVLMISFCSDKPDNKFPIDSNLRILTYNVWYGFTKVPDRKSLWLDWMKSQNPDIVFLQELNEYNPELLKKDAEFWGHQFSVLLKQDGFPTGVTSKYPIEDIQRYLEGFHHGLIRTKIKGIYFYCVYLHPSNWEFRKNEINLILDDIRKLPENANIVLAGDFNTFSPHDKSYYSHQLLEPFFAKRDKEYNEQNLNGESLDYTVLLTLIDNGFSDLEYLMRNDEYTFTGTFPTLIEKPIDHGHHRRLDYVFSTSELSNYVHRASIISNDTTQILSDHLPIIVDFEND